ncbi:PREDICTED: F-box only protein 33 [Polistes dominula]|uniref:F-box only protein 33 n=1 Tax=Polistes dominula TaxID=743375 RepID=A0ABM1IB54_POLDO|nr:PREDICTED: F-box only protein 33 [Polistes dominula]
MTSEWLKMLHAGNEAGIWLEKLKHHEESDTVEEAKKCESQLSSMKANSCSPCIAPNRTMEMEQEDNNSCWSNLPCVILQEIFSYLSHENRIIASQVCRNWRTTLFHPSFWRKITFVLKDSDSILWSRSLADSFGLSVHEATIKCDIPSHIVETSYILKKLSCNRQLRKLFLEYSSNICERTNWYMESETDSPTNSVSLMKSIAKIIERSNHLEALSLGYIEELATNADLILEPLILHHAKHLTHLSLASVKDDPEHYDFIELEEYNFKSFIRLTVLTVDYDVVNDALLRALDSGTMRKLVIHVHGWHTDYLGTSNAGWELFVQKNPKCELRLNLIHSYLGVQVLHSEILQPAMPLTQLKILFCEKFNIEVLHRLSSWYFDTFKSLIWIDSIDTTVNTPATYDPNEPDSPDPLVFVAWKCTNLVEIVLIGHKYYQENLLAIARLRGSKLEHLIFAESDIASDSESWHKTDAINHEIQEIMGRHWSPLSRKELPTVVLNPFAGDSREVIMPFILCDEK